jgi:hypothetical protein
MNDTSFKIGTYGFAELAQRYFPGITVNSASRILSRWISRNHELVAALQETGWKKRQKYFTPRQVKILVRHFDPPD